jgi:transcriptional regulator with XRE-family HTH domain
MTKDEFRNMLTKIGLSQSEAARRLGVDVSTVQRWAADGVTNAPALLFRAISNGWLTIEQIDKLRKCERRRASKIKPRRKRKRGSRGRS